MARTRQHVLEFDSLEGKVLLSTTIADPAATVFQQKAHHFRLDGTLYGIPSGTAVPNGFLVSSFIANGHVSSMGNVEVAFFLKHTYIPTGKLPNLSKASLVLINQKGTVNISLDATGSHHYKCTVMSGTGTYTFASGIGKVTISAGHKSPGFTIKLQSK
jgi:hypothetical protein